MPRIDISSATRKLSGTGSTDFLPIIGRELTTSNLLPSIFVALSPGAQLTYTVEITGDATDLNGNFPAAPSVVVPFDATAVAQTVSGLWNLAGTVTGIRVTITSYTSGSLTLQLVQ